MVQLASMRLWLRVYESTAWSASKPATATGPDRRDGAFSISDGTANSVPHIRSRSRSVAAAPIPAPSDPAAEAEQDKRRSGALKREQADGEGGGGPALGQHGLLGRDEAAHGQIAEDDAGEDEQRQGVATMDDVVEPRRGESGDRKGNGEGEQSGPLRCDLVAPGGPCGLQGGAGNLHAGQHRNGGDDEAEDDSGHRQIETQGSGTAGRASSHVLSCHPGQPSCNWGDAMAAASGQAGSAPSALS